MKKVKFNKFMIILLTGLDYFPNVRLGFFLLLDRFRTIQLTSQERHRNVTERHTKTGIEDERERTRVAHFILSLKS